MRIGNVVFYSFGFGLTSKGSATGDASIDGFPFPGSAIGNGVRGFVNDQNNIDLDPGFTFACIRTQSGTTDFKFGQTGPSTATNTAFLTDANFANNSTMIASGFYFV
jgi:hypothetical protein